jgi:hypothetical protein
VLPATLATVFLNGVEMASSAVTAHAETTAIAGGPAATPYSRDAVTDRPERHNCEACSKCHTHMSARAAAAKAGAWWSTSVITAHFPARGAVAVADIIAEAAAATASAPLHVDATAHDWHVRMLDELRDWSIGTSSLRHVCAARLTLVVKVHSVGAASQAAPAPRYLSVSAHVSGAFVDGSAMEPWESDEICKLFGGGPARQFGPETIELLADANARRYRWPRDAQAQAEWQPWPAVRARKPA